MPRPRGRRPSIAALTRVGARKAIDRVRLIWRVLQWCLLAKSSIDAVPETIASSHWRPRAIDRISPDLLSARMGLIRCAKAVGWITSRNFLAGGLDQGIRTSSD